MRIGLFGGTFDPIHMGHLILAESCREACALDRVWFVVTATPPHKRGERTDVSHRLEMARIAVAGHQAFEVSELEAGAEDGPHYSFQTLERVHRDHPGDEFFFLIGADSLADLPGWRNPRRIAELATIVVVNRLGGPPPGEAPRIEGIDESRFVHVNIPTIGISSTNLRRRVARGESIRYQVPRGVEVYVAEHRLYQSGRNS